MRIEYCQGGIASERAPKARLRTAQRETLGRRCLMMPEPLQGRHNRVMAIRVAPKGAREIKSTLTQRSTTPTRANPARVGDPGPALGFPESSRKRDSDATDANSLLCEHLTHHAD